MMKYFKRLCIAIAILSCSFASKATPIRLLDGLESVTFFEQTGPLSSVTFLTESAQLTNRLNTLNSASRDFIGATTEFYDVFYSDSDGLFDINGEFITISTIFNFALPFGGGLNITEVRLNFENSIFEFANVVSSFTSFGNNANPASVANAIDQDLATSTTLGNTIGQSQRLSLTLGFASSTTAVPEPSNLLLFVPALALFGFYRRARR